MLGLAIKSLIVPIILLVLSWYLLYRTPGRNRLIGYRSRLSMKNDATWNFSNKYFGKLGIRLALILMVCDLILLLIGNFGNIAVGIIEMAIVIIDLIGVIYSIIKVEEELKRNFDRCGNRK